MRPAVFLHAIGIAAWSGALLPLLIALHDPTGPHILNRFSRRIPIVVALLLGSGAVLAIVQVQTPMALLETDYGRVLLSKLLAVAAVFAIASWNRFGLTAGVLNGDSASVHRMRQSIAIELVFMMTIFGAAGLWRFTPPPRALGIAAAQPASVHIHTLKAMADISLTPGRAGPIRIDIILLNGEFGPLPAKELRAAFSNKAVGIEAIEQPAVLGADGIWRIDRLTLPVPGRWTVELEILISDFEMIRLTEEVEIRP